MTDSAAVPVPTGRRMRRRLLSVGAPVVALGVLVATATVTWTVWDGRSSGPAVARWSPAEPVAWWVDPGVEPALTSRTVATFGGTPPATDLADWGSVAETPGAHFALETRSRLTRTGATRSVIGYVLDDAAITLARISTVEGDVAVDPSVTVLPVSAAAGSSWTSTATLLRYGNTIGTLRVDARVLGAADAAGCLTVESTRTLDTDADDRTSTLSALLPPRSQDRWCPSGWWLPVSTPAGPVRSVAPQQVSTELRNLATAEQTVTGPTALVPLVGADGWPGYAQPPAFAPLRAGPVVVVGQQTRQSVEAVREDSGELVWSQVFASPITTAPTFVAGVLVVAESSGRLWGLDPATGIVRWSTDVGSPIAAVSTSRVNGRGALVVTWAGRVFTLGESSGRLLAVGDVEGPVRGLTATADGWWVTAVDGTLTRIAADGSVSATIAASGVQPSVPVVVLSRADTSDPLLLVPGMLGDAALVDPTDPGHPQVFRLTDIDSPEPLQASASGTSAVLFAAGSGTATLVMSDGGRRHIDSPVVAALAVQTEAETRWLVVTGTTGTEVTGGVSAPALAVLDTDATLSPASPLPGPPDPRYPLSALTTPVIIGEAVWFASSEGVLRVQP